MITEKITKAEKLVEQYGDSGFAVVNKNTGEYYTLPVYSKTMLPPDKNQMNYKNTHRMNFLHKELFTKMFKLPIIPLMQTLSYRDFTWFIGMTIFIHPENNILMYEGAYLTIKRISELLNINYDSLRKAFVEYTKQGIVIKYKAPSLKNTSKMVNVLAINPFVVFNGKNIEKSLHELCKDTFWAHLYSQE